MRKPAVLLSGMMLGVAGCYGGDMKTEPAGGGAPAGKESAFTNRMNRKEEHTLKEHRSGEWSPGLSEEDKQTLFGIARDTLVWSVKGGGGKFSFEKYPITAKLKEKSATFVTFKNPRKAESLRGCIGCLVAQEAMYLSVHRSASSAAHDSRFAYDPITEEEIPEIVIHVSLLSEMRPIESLDEFKVGEHGILLEKGVYNHAVFLPEVAVEQKWTKEQTLTALSRKAGLAGDAWRSGARFKVYSSVVLSEEE